MRALPIAAAALLVLATPSVALAQDASLPKAKPFTEMSEKLSDPAFQDQAAMMGQVLVQMLLEMPVGPMADAMHKATDGRTPAIDPEAKIKDIAPDAQNLPREVAENLPMAMDAMSGVTQGMQEMLPALRDMARRMRSALPPRASSE